MKQIDGDDKEAFLRLDFKEHSFDVLKRAAADANPLPLADILAELDRYPAEAEIAWVQEEPANMGALSYVLPRIRTYFPDIPARSVKRSASASPATGSSKAHELEQKTLLSLAFTTTAAE